MATVRALKMHGGLPKEKLGDVDTEALRRGIPNLEKHVLNMLSFGMPAVVAINVFPTDTEEEIGLIREVCAPLGVPVVKSDIWAQGGRGGLEMADAVTEACSKPNDFKFLYEPDMSPEEKIAAIATKIYGAADVAYTDRAKKDLRRIRELCMGELVVCMAKTQASLSDDPEKKGRPEGFTLTVREGRLSAGAGFLIPMTGTIMTMPGLPKRPAACSIDVDSSGMVTWLF